MRAHARDGVDTTTTNRHKMVENKKSYYSKSGKYKKECSVHVMMSDDDACDDASETNGKISKVP